jgi:hypothetical protein
MIFNVSMCRKSALVIVSLSLMICKVAVRDLLVDMGKLNGSQSSLLCVPAREAFQLQSLDLVT